MDLTTKKIKTSDLAKYDIVAVPLSLGPVVGTVKKVEENEGGGVDIDLYYGVRFGWYAEHITVVDNYEPNR